MNSTQRLLFACSLITGLSACSLKAPQPQPLASLPAAWKNAAGFPVASPDSDLARWWKYFDDPTLNRIISDGLAHSPDVVSATARVREARAARASTAASLFPFVSGSGSAANRTFDARGASSVSDTTYSAGLDASWEVDLFGKNRSNLAAASAEVGAAAENLHSVRSALAAEIASAYTNLRADETRLEVLLRNVSTREETAQLAEWRRQAGEADALESSQAASSLEQARAAIPSLHQSIAQGQNLLARLCGRQPGELDSVLSAGKQRIPDPARRLAVGIPADTIRQRPDVRLAGYQLIAAVARNRSARAEQFPSLNLSGSVGVTALAPEKLFDPETTTTSLVAGLAGPIFDAGRIRANIDAADAVTDQTLETYRGAVLTALSEVEDALIACRRSAERLVSLEKATQLARESDEIARQRYQAGEIDFLDVLDSQRTVLGLEDSLLSSRTDRTTAYIRLYQALGGGWSSSS